jgi:hypothetical protein
MIRKLAICAAVALAPSFAFAAGAVTNNGASTETHVTGAEVKTDAAVKADVKSDAAAKTTKAVHHRAAKKASAKTKVDTKTDAKDSAAKL